MKKRETKKQLPTKTTMNLVIREKTWSSPSRVTPIFLVALVLIALFSKFAVADRLAQVSQAQAEVNTISASIAQLKNDFADYDQVEAQYRQYSFGSLTDEERALCDRLAVLDLLEERLMGAAQVKNLVVGDNSLSLTLAGISLEQASGLVASLEQSEIVYSVAVYTAGYGQDFTQGTELSLITMTITLVGGGMGGGQ